MDLERSLMSNIASSPMVSSTPKLRRGDIVQRINQPEMVGQILSERRNPQTEQWEYSVQFASGQRVVPEEAIRRFQPVQSPWQALEEGCVSGFEAFVCNLTYHRLKHPPARIANSFATARTQFYPHQFKPLLKFLDNPVKGILIADDVGLGKTIEAGYILRELDARHGRLDRVLIVVPARLQRKWRKEMRDRFNEHQFDLIKAKDLLYQTELIRKGRVPDQFRWIVSYEAIRSEEVANALHETLLPIDALIVDESHRVRNPDTFQHKTIAALCQCSDSIVFLSATPVMTSLENLWNQLKLLSPTEFLEWPVFSQQIRAHQQLLQIQRALSTSDPQLKSAQEMFADYVRRFTSEEGRAGEFFSSITDRLQSPQLEKQWLLTLQSDIGLLSPVGHMISRTRKVEALPNRPLRDAHWVPVDLSSLERNVYDSVESLCRVLWPSTEDFGFQMSLLMAYRITASCIPAAMGYFRDKLTNGVTQTDRNEDSDEDDAGDSVPQTAWKDPQARTRLAMILQEYERAAMPDSKFDNFATLLANIRKDDQAAGRRPRKLVVFSFFRRTLEYLASRLSSLGVRNRYIHGLVPVDEREHAIDDFVEDPEINVLLTSEVGGEGIDLQAACVVVNYDLPWNPMVVEQRIGRIDRIGQESPILYIFNLVVSGSVEELILKRLLDRIEIFRQSIGELDEIIGGEIEDLAVRAIRGQLNPEQLEVMVKQTGEAVTHRLSSARTMLREVDGLLAADQALIQEINAVAGERQLPSENELLLYLNSFLGPHFPGTTLPTKAAKDVVAADLHGPLAAAIESNVNKLGDEAKLFANRISSGEVLLTLSRDAAYRHHRAELIHLQHPLAQFVVSEESASSSIAGAFSLSLDSCTIPAGKYLFLVTLIHVFGQRPLTKLIPIFASLDSEQVWNIPEETTAWMLEILDHARDAAFPNDVKGFFDATRSRLLEAVDRLKADWEARERRLDQARREQQLRTKLASLDYRIRRATETHRDLTNSKAKDFAIRMALKRLEKAKNERQVFMDSLPSSTWQPIEHEEIAVGTLVVEHKQQ